MLTLPNGELLKLDELPDPTTVHEAVLVRMSDRQSLLFLDPPTEHSSVSGDAPFVSAELPLPLLLRLRFPRLRVERHLSLTWLILQHNAAVLQTLRLGHIKLRKNCVIESPRTPVIFRRLTRLEFLGNGEEAIRLLPNMKCPELLAFSLFGEPEPMSLGTVRHFLAAHAPTIETLELPIANADVLPPGHFRRLTLRVHDTRATPHNCERLAGYFDQPTTSLPQQLSLGSGEFPLAIHFRSRESRIQRLFVSWDGRCLSSSISNLELKAEETARFCRSGAVILAVE